MHVLVQPVHVGHAAITQSTAHACALQLRDSSECGQATPPFSAGMLVRLRDVEPVPHDLVHVLQALNEPTTQFTAHKAVLQARVSAACGHTTPPFTASTRVRLRLCEPVPHDRVQVDQAPKAE